MISIIVPVYNVADTLDKCITSILSQPWQDLEILLINDGSTDGSGILCHRWSEKDERVRVFEQLNQGVSAARNVGIENSKGEWVCFIDSDDWIQGEYLPKMFDEGVDMYIQDELVDGIDMFNKLGITKEQTVMTTEDFLQKYGHTSIFRGVCSKFCRLEILQKNNIRFNTSHRFGEDLLFFMQYIRFCHFIGFFHAGFYVYEPNPAWIVKYNYSEAETFRFFDDFVAAYNALPASNIRLVQSVYNTYELMSHNKGRISLSWKLNPSVLAVKRLLIAAHGPGFAIRYLIASILSSFYRL